MPTGSVLRRAYVEVEPSVDGFDKSLTEKLARQDPGNKAGKQVGGQINRALKRFDLAPIDVKADPKSALAGIAVAEAKLRELSGKAATVEVKIQTDKALGQLARFRKQIGDVAEDAGPEAALGFAAKFSQRLGPLLASAPVSGPVIAAVGAAAAVAAPVLASAVSGAIIGGAGIGGVIGGLALAAKDPRVKAAAEDVADGLKDRLNGAAGAFVEPAIAGIGQIKRAIDTINIEGIFAKSASFVRPLVAGVTAAITFIGDAVEKLVKNADGPIKAIADGIALIGGELGAGLASLSDNAEEGEAALRILFSVIGTSVKTVFMAVNALTELYGIVHNLGLDRGLMLMLKLTGNEMNRVGESGRRGGEGTFALKESIDAAAGAARGELAAISALSKELRAQTDPAFALLNAQDALKKAQDAAAEATKRHGRNSVEARTATRNLAIAALDLQGKAGALAKGFDGTLTPAMRATYKAAGLTESQINDVERELNQARGAADKYAGNYKANVTLTGANGVRSSLDKLLIQQQALKKGIPISAAAAAYNKNAYASGGWTGPGAKYDEAGVVHADEFVIKKESRRKIERTAPGLLNKLNATGQLPPYAAGGQVWPFPTTAAMTRVPSKAEAMSAVTPALPPGGRTSDWIVAAAKALVPGIRVISKDRPGARTLSGNVSYHARGRAVDFAPSEKLARLWNANYKARTKELISPYQRYNIHNGARHTYTGAVWRQHNFAGGNAHDHIAMAGGGVIGEPVYGVGRSGRSYSFGERGPETVTPGVGGGAVHFHFHGPVASKKAAQTMVLEAYQDLVKSRKIT